MAGTLKVDDVILSSPQGIAITIVFLMSLGLHFYSFYKMSFDEVSIFKYAIVINGLSLFMLPCISNDLFSLLGYGDMFDYSSKVFSNPISEQSEFYTLVSKLYTEIPNVYGLGSLILVKGVIIKSQLLASIFSFKLLCFCLVSVSIILLKNLNNIEKKNIAYVLLNPLWTIQALGQSHTEVIALALFLIVLYFISKQRIVLSAVFFGLAVLTKISLIICFPIAILYYYDKMKLSKIEWIRFFLIYFIIGAILIAFLWIYFGNLDALTLPLNTLSSLWLTGSFAAYIVDIFHSYFGNQYSTSILLLIFKCIFFIYTGLLFYRYKENFKSNSSSMIYYGLLAFLMLYSHRLLTWYLLLVLPLFFWLEDKSIRRDLLVLTFGLTLQDAAHFNHFKYLHLGILILGIGLTIVYQIKLLVAPFRKFTF